MTATEFVETLWDRTFVIVLTAIKLMVKKVVQILMSVQEEGVSSKINIDLLVKMAKHHTDNLPCGQSGKCVNSWGSYNCECPKGLIFKGILVQVTECLFQ